MTTVISRLVRRWGARAVGLVLTAIGLYVVFPGLLTLFGSWPRLREITLWWFVVVVALVIGSMASLWWLTRLALRSRTGPHGTWSTVSWGTAASAHLAGNAAGKIVPGGPATAGVVQARLLIQSGQPAAAVASAITAMGLLTTGILLMLPILTIPALLIGPPPARKLEYGLVVSVDAVRGGDRTARGSPPPPGQARPHRRLRLRGTGHGA
jgi:hypothetical protein